MEKANRGAGKNKHFIITHNLTFGITTYHIFIFWFVSKGTSNLETWYKFEQAMLNHNLCHYIVTVM